MCAQGHDIAMLSRHALKAAGEASGFVIKVIRKLPRRSYALRADSGDFGLRKCSITDANSVDGAR